MNQARALNPTEAFRQQVESISSLQANPGISMGWQTDLNEAWQLGLWMARVSRSGSLTERYIHCFPVGLDPYELLGNPQLKPETNNQLDVSLQYRPEHFSFSLRLFAAYLTDYITGKKKEN